MTYLVIIGCFGDDVYVCVPAADAVSAIKHLNFTSAVRAELNLETQSSNRIAQQHFLHCSSCD